VLLKQRQDESYRREGFKTLDSAAARLGVERRSIKLRQRGFLEEFTQKGKNPFQRDAAFQGGLSGVYISVRASLIT
jgi:hypothetical protein